VIKIFAIADGLIPSVELVLLKPLQHLQNRGEVTFHFALITEANLAGQIDEYDLIILMRCYQSQAVEIANTAKARGIPVIYAIDDDLEEIDPATPHGAVYRAANAWQKVLEICSGASQVWAFSNSLRDKIEKVNPRVVVPPAIASLELISSLRVAAGERTPDVLSQRLVLGYAATTFHAADIEPIVDVLNSMLEKFPQLELEFIGVACEALRTNPRVTHFDGFNRVDDYYAFILERRWDVAIAPLLRSPANDAKTDNKYREYASLGIPAVYSNAPPYWSSVIHNYNGLVAAEAAEWEACLSSLLSDAVLRAEIVEHSFKDVEVRYGLDKVSRRYLDLMRSATMQTHRVLVVAHSIPTTDIDIVRPFRRLEAEGAIEWRLKTSLEATHDDVSWAEVVVIVRDSEPEAVALARAARDIYGVPIIFSWDDDFFSIPDSLGLLAKHHRDPTTVAGLEEMLATSQLVKASTSRLAARSRLYTDKVIEVPYGFDFDQLAGAKVGAGASVGVTIGFFGSVTHLSSLDIVLGALRRVCAEMPEVRLEFFGPRSAVLDGFRDATFIPYKASSEDALRSLAERGWDIGLGPLEINDFNRAKLPTKYRDYAACNIAGIYTRIDPYEAVVIDGVSGLLVDNTEEAWHEAIMQLVTDARLRRRISAAAQAHVRGSLSLDQAIDAWRHILATILPEQAGSAKDVAAAYERKLRSADVRIERLEAQLAGVKGAAKALLHNQARPLSRKLADRVLRRLLRYRPGLTGLPDAEPSTAGIGLAGREGPGPSPTSSVRLSANLQHMPYLEYEVGHTSRSGSVLRVPLVATVPYLDGSFGIELVTPQDTIAAHLVQRIAHLGADMVAVFAVGEVALNGAGWRLRLFARESDSPIFVHEHELAGSSRAVCVFELESKPLAT
jgi:glycosyltransferase involved in cell wall biosynthesis